MSGRIQLSDKPDATYTLTRTDLDNVVLGQEKLDEPVKHGKVKVEVARGRSRSCLACWVALISGSTL